MNTWWLRRISVHSCEVPGVDAIPTTLSYQAGVEDLGNGKCVEIDVDNLEAFLLLVAMAVHCSTLFAVHCHLDKSTSHHT